MTGMTDISRHGGDRKNRDERDIKVKDDALIDPELLAATSGCLMQAENLVDDSDDDDGYDFDNAGPGLAAKVVRNGFKLLFFPLILAYRGVMSLKHLPWLCGRIGQGVKQGPGAILRIGPFFKSLFSPTGRLGKALVILGTVTGVIWVSRKIAAVGASWSAKRKARRIAAEEATLEAEIRAEETAAKTAPAANSQSHQTHAGHSQHGHTHSAHGHRKVTATVQVSSPQQQPDTVTFSSQLQQQQQSQTAQQSQETKKDAASADESGHEETRESRKKFGLGKLNKIAAAFKRSDSTASDDAASPNDSAAISSKPEKSKWRWSKRDKTTVEDAHDPFAESGSRWSAKKSALFAAACLVLLIGGFSVARQVMQKGDDVALNAPDGETPVTSFDPDDNVRPSFGAAPPKTDYFPQAPSTSASNRNTVSTKSFLDAQQDPPPSGIAVNDPHFSNQVPTQQLPDAPQTGGDVPAFSAFGQFSAGGDIANGNADNMRFQTPESLPVPGTPGGTAENHADSPIGGSFNDSSYAFADNTQSGQGTAMHIRVTGPSEETPYEEIPVADNRTPAAPATPWAPGPIASGYGDEYARDESSVAFAPPAARDAASALSATPRVAFDNASVPSGATTESASPLSLSAESTNAAVTPALTPVSTSATAESDQFVLTAAPRTPQSRSITTTPEYDTAAQATPRSDSFTLGENDTTSTQLQSSPTPTVRENAASLADIYANSQTPRNAGNSITTGPAPTASNSTGLAAMANVPVEQDGWDSAPEPQITRQTEGFSLNVAATPASAAPAGEIPSQQERQPLQAHAPSGGGFSLSQNTPSAQDTFTNANVEPLVANNSPAAGSNAFAPFAENQIPQAPTSNGGSFALTPQATQPAQQQIQQPPQNIVGGAIPTQYADASTPASNPLNTFSTNSINAQPLVTGTGNGPVAPIAAANANSPAVLPLPDAVHESLNAGVVSPSQQMAAMPMVSANSQSAASFSPPVLAQADTPAPSYAAQPQLQPIRQSQGQSLHEASQQVAGLGVAMQAATVQPLNSGASAGVYIVQPGDNIYKIAKQELGSVKRYREIYELNRDRIPIGQDTLTAGTELLIPNM